MHASAFSSLITVKGANQSAWKRLGRRVADGTQLKESDHAASSSAESNRCIWPETTRGVRWAEMQERQVRRCCLSSRSHTRSPPTPRLPRHTGVLISVDMSHPAVSPGFYSFSWESNDCWQASCLSAHGNSCFTAAACLECGCVWQRWLWTTQHRVKGWFELQDKLWIVEYGGQLSLKKKKGKVKQSALKNHQQNKLQPSRTTKLVRLSEKIQINATFSEVKVKTRTNKKKAD